MVPCFRRGMGVNWDGEVVFESAAWSIKEGMGYPGMLVIDGYWWMWLR